MFRHLSLSVGLALGLTWGAVLAHGQTPAACNILPATTRGYLSIPNVPQFEANWDRTALAELLSDPVMQPFRDDFRRQLDEKWTKTRIKLGFSTEDLQGLATGELSVACIETEAGTAALAALVDVTNNLERAHEALKKVAQTLLEQGAERSERTIAGVKVDVFELVEEDEHGPARFACYFLHENLLGATDDLGVLEDLLTHLSGDGADRLVQKVAFTAVMERVRASANELPPDIRWYVEPLEFASIIRESRPDDSPQGDTDWLKILKKQGFTSLQGVGGHVNFAVERYETLHRVFVYAPPPFAKAMRMLQFPNGGEYVPQPWASRNLATYATFQWDMQNAFDKFGSLFDELFGEGEEGVWEDVLESIKTEPNGPQIDLERDLIAHLGTRATMIRDYSLPITPTSTRKLFAAEATNAEALADAIARSMRDDPQVRHSQVAGFDVWEVVNEEHAVPTIELEHPGAVVDEEEAAEDEGLGEPRLPNSAIVVAHGHLFIASHVDMLEKVLILPPEHELLANDVDFRIVSQELTALGADETCLRSFALNDEKYRVTYELFRQGRLPEADTVLASILNTLLTEKDQQGPRPAEIDASTLPEFDVVRRYLGPGGSFASTEENGWFLTAFELSKGEVTAEAATVDAGAPPQEARAPDSDEESSGNRE